MVYLISNWISQGDRMGKLMVLLAGIVSLIGCSNDNQIIIENKADYPIYFTFRSSQNTVNPNGQTTISDIPNGDYAVAIGIQIPPSGASSWSVTPPSATFSFNKKSTKIRTEFYSTFVSGIYAVTWNYSSTDPVTSTSTGITSP